MPNVFECLCVEGENIEIFNSEIQVYVGVALLCKLTQILGVLCPMWLIHPNGYVCLKIFNSAMLSMETKKNR